jgi:hypothetical protein
MKTMKNKIKISSVILATFLLVFILPACYPQELGIVQDSLTQALHPEAIQKELDSSQPVISSFSDSKGNVQFFSEVNDEFSENQPLGKFSVSPGEIIDFEVELNYEGDLYYRFGYTAIESQDSPYILLEDWSDGNEFSWQIPEDIPLSVIIVVIAQVKNNDGVEHAGNSIMGFCDDSAVLTYKAR